MLLCVTVCYCVLLRVSVLLCHCCVGRVKCRADTTGEHARQDLSWRRMCEFAKTYKTCNGPISFDQAENADWFTDL